MKKIQRVLGVAAALLAMVSCAKEVINPIDIKSKTDEYSVIGGGQVAIAYTIAELGGAEFKTEITCTNPDVEIENTVIGENGVMVVTAPYAFYENSFSINLKAVDDAGARTAEKKYSVTVFPNGRIEEVGANCYKADPGEYLMVPAKKGFNGADAAAESLGLLWQDDSALVASFKLDESKKNIIIEFNPDVQGNAVIAAYDSKKAVQWSWHFWVMKDTLGVVEVQDTLTKITYKLMDRNIGAINVNEFNEGSMGTVYQWGRKDAYAGQVYSNGKDYANNALRKMYGVDDAGNVTVVERKSELCTVVNNIENSIANPMTVYYQVYSSKGKGNYSWLTTDYTQWNADELKNLWSANGVKSIYDPCPAGYRVAPKVAFDAVKTQLNTENMLKDDTYVVDPSVSDGWQEKYRAQNEVKVQFRGGLFGDAYFMVTGDISHTLNCSNGISQLQPSAEAWSSTLDDFVSVSSASYFRAFAIKVNASISASSTNPEKDMYMSVNSKNGLNLGYELPVRCIKE